MSKLDHIQNYKSLGKKLVPAVLMLLDKKEYTVVGSPTTEAEFNANFTKHDNEDWSGWWDQIESALAAGGALPMAIVRQERDKKIAESDFKALTDVTLSTAWKNYRTALRDLPANSTNASWDGETLGNVTWPTEPS